MREIEFEKNKITYGRLTIAVPMSAKLSIMHWQKKSGLKKSEFLRGAILIGANTLANQTCAKKVDEGFEN